MVETWITMLVPRFHGAYRITGMSVVGIPTCPNHPRYPGVVCHQFLRFGCSFYLVSDCDIATRAEIDREIVMPWVLGSNAVT